MKREILITIFCVGLMIVTPLKTIAQENKISNILSDKPDIDGLVAKIRVVVNDILQKYNHIPMVNIIFELILNMFFLLYWVTICLPLAILILLVFILFVILSIFDSNFDAYDFIDKFMPLFYLNEFLCDSGTWTLISFHTLSETSDITKTFDGCPCLQE